VHESISTAGGCARAGALRVIGDGVSCVALLARMEDPVAADLLGAGGAAAVVVLVVAVIAALVRLYYGVPADFVLTDGAAPVAVVLIAVVARLRVLYVSVAADDDELAIRVAAVAAVALLSTLEIDDAIAADRVTAGVGADILVIAIPVIAVF
jgi:predicted glycosyltransferase